MSRDPETVTVTDLRVATREIVENAHFRGRHYIVARAGQPMVAIIGVEEYQRLMTCLEPDPSGVTLPKTPPTA